MKKYLKNRLREEVSASISEDMTLCNKMTINSYEEAVYLVNKALDGLDDANKQSILQRIQSPLNNLKEASRTIKAQAKYDDMSGDSLPDEADTYWSQIQSTICELGGDGLTEAKKEPEIKMNDNFKTWFGNSKVVDDQGQPLICYHGTNAQIRQFNSKFSAQGVFWFSSDKDKIMSGNAGASGRSNIIPVFISAEKLAGWPEYEKYGLGQIRGMGYQAIKLDDDYVVFDANRIKSIHNKGNWSLASKNIFS